MMKKLLSVLAPMLFACSWVPVVSQVSLPAPQERVDVLSQRPKNLLITYRCQPADRPALREYLKFTEIPKLEALVHSRVLSSKKVLFSRYADTANWDLAIFLEFSSPEKMEQWNDLERTSPAGFDIKGLKLVSEIATYPIDMVGSETRLGKVTNPVFLVIPYHYTVAKDAYIQYLHGYVFPQTSGWMAEGILTSYSMYVGRGAEARPWSSVLLLEYRDDEALGKREAVVAKVRERLKSDPAWKALSDSKHSVRTENAPIVAEELN